MRGAFERLKWKMGIWMQGCYGQDLLSMHMCWAALLLFFVGTVFEIDILTPVSFVFWICAVFRICSKQIVKREKELAFYKKILDRPMKWISSQKRKWTERKRIVISNAHVELY